MRANDWFASQSGPQVLAAMVCLVLGGAPVLWVGVLWVGWLIARNSTRK